MSFQGFDDKDFDAFIPKKWSSNAFTLERRAVKEKLVALCEKLSQREELGELELEQTEDAPSIANGRKVQSIASYFVRPESVREGLTELLKTDLGSGPSLFQIAVHQQHAHLYLRVDHTGCALGLRIPPKAKVDRENISEKLALDWAPGELAEVFTDAPEAVQFGFEKNLRPVSQWSNEEIKDLSNQMESSKDSLVLERSWSRDDDALARAAFAEDLVEAASRIAPAFTFLAWSKTNDHSKVTLQVKKEVQKAEKKAKAQALGRKPLEPGAAVTILGGLFAGRGGYLSELDSKGNAKVMVGPISVSVPVDEIKPRGA